MNKIFIVHRQELKGIRKGKPERLPVGEYWISVPPKSEGLLLFTPLTATKTHWLITHNEWRRGENAGIITSVFRGA